MSSEAVSTGAGSASASAGAASASASTRSSEPGESFDARTRDFKTWSDFFHKYGYIVINNAISPDQISKLKSDLVKADDRKTSTDKTRHIVHKRFFEHSRATVDLIETSVLTDFAQYLIEDCPGERGNNLTAHVIHNNAFTVPPGGRGQAPTWHTDDAPQQIIISDGYPPLRDDIKLPVMVATYMIWLSDCDKPENGPTYIAPGSHRSGKVVNPKIAEERAIPACGMAGTAVLVNNQTWHRGCENTSKIARQTLQITYARRIIGHKFGSIMNYVMPPSVLKGRRDKTYERFGYLEGGAYS
jgi:ectoine hydroxylase-related dioxygenase (phytanoyl-CoA dioxygenase family)